MIYGISYTVYDIPYIWPMQSSDTLKVYNFKAFEHKNTKLSIYCWDDLKNIFIEKRH